MNTRSRASKRPVEEEVLVGDPAEGSLSAGKPKASLQSELIGLKSGPKTKRVKRNHYNADLVLKDLVEMPMDILLEVHIRASEPCGPVGAISDDKAAAKDTYESLFQVRLDAHDLSEPQYAELITGNRCFDCDKRSATNVIWSARAKYCNDCFISAFPYKRDSYWIDSRSYPANLASLMPSIFVKEKYQRSFQMCDRYHRYTDLSWEKEYKALSTNEERKEWVQEKIATQRTINAHGEACDAWAARNRLHSKRVLTLQDRHALIVDRVKQLGWGDEYARIRYSFAKPQCKRDIFQICQKPNFTERTLLGLDGRLNDIMKGLKKRRLSEDVEEMYKDRLSLFVKVYATYIETLPLDSIYPNAVELLKIPVVERLIKKTPPTIELTENAICEALDFCEITSFWKNSLDAALIRLIRHGLPDAIFDESTVLNLATTYFHCKRCDPVPLRKEDIYMHRCRIDSRWLDPATPEPTDPEAKALKHVLKEEKPWNWNGMIYFDVHAFETLTSLVKMCRRDPTTTTAQDMDNADHVIECLACNDQRLGRRTMKWSCVANHSNYHRVYGKKEPIELLLLHGEDANRARLRINEDSERAKARYVGNNMLCYRCHEQGDIASLRKHAKKQHAKSIPIIGADFGYKLEASESHLGSHDLWPPRSEKLD
ncbi:hypothetical protein NLJ89_g112 [Agrocybe chaxingu]|uniref:Uncharacterized protein n=1 Tax=Agrocybe chaxingu TaxID=84603 RepID=A0A9W8N2I8_9AGAR|nr:hypothetical protein NLJ89_g112 [Agrocybe chaxingu]